MYIKIIEILHFLSLALKMGYTNTLLTDFEFNSIKTRL